LSHATERPADQSERHEFPAFREELGEDPARFLDRDLLAKPERPVYDTDDRGRTVVRWRPDMASAAGVLVRDRIRGIDDVDVLTAWRQVERRLARGEDGGPRDRVLKWLDEREAELRDLGERPDRLPFGPRRRREKPDDRDVFEWDTDDGEQRSTFRSVSRRFDDGGGS
jgi:hypothetical protein